MKHLRLFGFCICLVLIVPNLNAQWVQTSCPTGTAVRALYTRNSTIFAGTWGNGITVSSDSGKTWTYHNVGLTDSFVNCILANDRYLFAGTQDSGMFRSSDNGNTWEMCNTGIVGSLNGLPNGSVVALGLVGNSVLAGTYANALISSDNGSHWRTINAGLLGMTPSAFLTQGNNLFAATNGAGIFLSGNTGSSWTEANAGLNTNGHRVFSLCEATSNIIAGTEAGLFTSSNNGSAWYLRNPPNGFWGHILVVFAVGANAFAGSGNYFLQSSDAGLTWSSTSISVCDIRSIDTSDDFIYIATTCAGVWRRPLYQNLGVDADPHALDSPLKVFPNPVSSRTHIGFTTQDHGHCEIIIVNALGETVEHLFDGQMDSGQHSVEWNTSKRENGVYFAIMKTPSGVQRVPLCVQH